MNGHAGFLCTCKIRNKKVIARDKVLLNIKVLFAYLNVLNKNDVITELYHVYVITVKPLYLDHHWYRMVVLLRRSHN